jgi:hypothetical protein
MSLTAALMTAIGTLASVVVFLAGVIGYLWKELRAQYRERAKDSALFLDTLEQSRSKYSERVPPQERRTPSDPPAPHPHSLAGFYRHGMKTNPTRG